VRYKTRSPAVARVGPTVLVVTDLEGHPRSMDSDILFCIASLMMIVIDYFVMVSITISNFLLSNIELF